jgi:hypothetical protein
MGRRKLTRVLLESGCNPDIKNKVSHTIRPNPGRPPKSKNRQNPAESGDSSKFRGELRGAPKTKIRGVLQRQKTAISGRIRPNPGIPPKSGAREDPNTKIRRKSGEASKRQNSGQIRQNPDKSGDSSKIRGAGRGAPKTKIREKSGEASKRQNSGQIRQNLATSADSSKIRGAGRAEGSKEKIHFYGSLLMKFPRDLQNLGKSSII